MSNINILMTGAGAPGAAGILKCLQAHPSMHVIVADANSNAVGRYLNAEFEQIPLADNDSFIETVLSVCRKWNIHVLMPLVTRELLPLAKHKNQFELAGTKLLVSDAESLEIANNKSRLYQFLEWRGIEVPAYRVVDNVQQFKVAINELGFPQIPVCFKPSISNGSRGFRVMSEQLNELHILFNEKPFTPYINPGEAVRILSTGNMPELLVTEYLPGEEYSVDCLCDHGNPILVIPRLRKRMINGISVEGEFINESSVIDYCNHLIRAIRLHGNIGIQVKRATSGKFLVLEINPRVQGTTVAALGAGVNLPVLAIKQEFGLDIQPAELEVNWGTRFSRFWNEVFY